MKRTKLNIKTGFSPEEIHVFRYICSFFLSVSVLLPVLMVSEENLWLELVQVPGKRFRFCDGGSVCPLMVSAGRSCSLQPTSVPNYRVLMKTSPPGGSTQTGLQDASQNKRVGSGWRQRRDKTYRHGGKSERIKIESWWRRTQVEDRDRLRQGQAEDRDGMKTETWWR